MNKYEKYLKEQYLQKVNETIENLNNLVNEGFNLEAELKQPLIENLKKSLNDTLNTIECNQLFKKTD